MSTPATSDCCAPARSPATPRPRTDAHFDVGSGRHGIEQRTVDAGVFSMGDQSGQGNQTDGESPVHDVELAEFSIDATSVTNAAFADFVSNTHYVTEAESFGFSAVFHLALAADEPDVIGAVPGSPWWLGVLGADWRHPGGRHSDLDGLEDHPVVHVSWNDASAYCAWAGRQLPSEAQWECAARGGLSGARFPWGDDLLGDDSDWRCNIWQGAFPDVNSLADGWLTTAPVRSFAPNGFGLWQMIGNVWEWCADRFAPDYYERSPRVDPRGPDDGSARVIRGGSYLCHDSYCDRYRNSARTSNTPDSTTGNMGFRTVATAAEHRG